MAGTNALDIDIPEEFGISVPFFYYLKFFLRSTSTFVLFTCPVVLQ
jgi:hypothetical protein